MHGLARPFPASSRVVCLLLRHSGGPSGRRCGHPDGVTGRALVGALRRLGGSPRAREAGCAEEGAPGRAHRAGRAGLDARRLQHHGQVARSPRPARPAASPQGVMPPPPLPSSSRSVHPATFKPASPATPPPHFIGLPCSPGNVLPGCCRYPGKQRLRPSDAIRPLLPPPEPRHSSTPSAPSSWGQPLSDCTIFFAAHPGVEMPAHSAARRESRPASAFHDPAPGAVVAEVNGARVGEGGWDSQLPVPASSSSRGGSGTSRSRPVPGSQSPGCAGEAREIASPGCGALEEAAALLSCSGAGRCSLG